MTAPRSFVITVDVEADDEWQFTSAPPAYRGITALPQLQQLCDRYQVQPTYLVTFDVASDPTNASILRELAADGRCEIGAHMHPWRTPPLFPELDCETGYRPYLYDYPEEIQRQKMANLTDCLQEVFECPITSHRAGRWGIDAFGCDLLEQHGYVVDTSVTPLRDRRAQLGYPGGRPGPDFRRAPCEPYHPSRSDVSVLGSRQMLEIPLSTGIVGTGVGCSLHRKVIGMSGRAAAFGLMASRGLRKIGASHLVSLNPVQHRRRELTALVRSLRSEKSTVLNMGFHSSELIVGASPYIRTSSDRDHVWIRMETVFQMLSAHEAAASCGLTAAAISVMKRSNVAVASSTGCAANCEPMYSERPSQ